MSSLDLQDEWLFLKSVMHVFLFLAYHVIDRTDLAMSRTSRDFDNELAL